MNSLTIYKEELREQLFVPQSIEKRIEKNEKEIQDLVQQSLKTLEQEFCSLQETEFILNYERVGLLEQIKQTQMLYQEEWNTANERYKTFIFNTSKKVKKLLDNLKLFKEQQKEKLKISEKIHTSPTGKERVQAFLDFVFQGENYEARRKELNEIVGECLAIDEFFPLLQELTASFHLTRVSIIDSPPLLPSLDSCLNQSSESLEISKNIKEVNPLPLSQDLQNIQCKIQLLEDTIFHLKEETTNLHLFLDSLKMKYQDNWMIFTSSFNFINKILETLQGKIQRLSNSIVSEKLTHPYARTTGEQILIGVKNKTAFIANHISPIIHQTKEALKFSKN